MDPKRFDPLVRKAVADATDKQKRNISVFLKVSGDLDQRAEALRGLGITTHVGSTKVLIIKVSAADLEGFLSTEDWVVRVYGDIQFSPTNDGSPSRDGFEE